MKTKSFSAPLPPADWRTRDWAINVYRCERQWCVTTTVDMAAGTTPFIIGCPWCGASAESSCYPLARPIPDWVPDPTHEWYAPTPAELEKLLADANPRAREGLLDHFKRGGLFMRPWTGGNPIQNPFKR